MTDILPLLPADLRHMDEDEQALSKMPMLADRMAYHTKRLRVIRYVEGIAGVDRYKAKHLEAGSIQTRASTVAFQPKPKGYDDFLCNLVDGWFLSDVALAETNKADVEHLNRAMRPRRFNPDNHFSVPLSADRIGKLANVFAKHGAHLDTTKLLSMSGVRAAVKAAKGKRSVGRPFGSIGHISGDQLIAGGESFRIEQHSGHSCIRIMLNGVRVRLRLDALAEFIALAGLEHPSSLSSSYGIRIGEVAPNAETAPEADPLADILLENWPQPTPLLTGELAPDAEHRTLAERITARKAARLEQQAHPTACADGVDPLTSAPIDPSFRSN